ncbi:MAG: succinylglutamate desuccinylase/aspartoacylase family protein [Burkholderiaceae bacterium]|jgi:predicted deacylase|nr:succinylglutamate desuccinylase/aspartoacylase family protein [Burkholderiaceae bacterium]MCU0966569.1 succinylglutamate desuccinylase/aspartoacylase family protein [Burkholderiaceae bacterium]
MSTTPAIELQAPDLSRWAPGNTGTPYVWRFDSGRAGPHVMVQALTHGNEICGAIALDGLLGLQTQWQPLRGSLSLAFGNIAAFARWDPAQPDRSRYVDEDFNRVWADEALLGPRDSTELRRARELRPHVDAADLLLDIHSMREPCRPLMVCGADGRGGDKGAALSRQLKVPELLLIDTGHPAGLRMIERGPFADPQHARTAVLIECGQHWERDAAEVAQDTLLRFLGHCGVLPETFVAAQLKLLGRAPPAQQQLVRVTEAVVARSLDFRFVREFRALEVIPRAGELIATDGAHEFRAPYDDTVLVMPGTTNLKVGMTTVRLGRFES